MSDDEASDRPRPGAQLERDARQLREIGSRNFACLVEEKEIILLRGL